MSTTILMMIYNHLTVFNVDCLCLAVGSKILAILQEVSANTIYIKRNNLPVLVIKLHKTLCIIIIIMYTCLCVLRKYNNKSALQRMC